MKILETIVTQIDGVNKRNTAVIKTFGEFLNDNLHRKIIVHRIRAAEPHLKQTLPCCQFAETNGKGFDGINRPSNVMQIDLDEKDNPGIDLKQAVSEIPYTAFAMLSAGGKGVFILWRISQPKQFKLHFAAALKVLAEYGLKADKAVSNPASLRFWSYDPNPIINDDAEVFRYIVQEPKKQAYGQKNTACSSNNPFKAFNRFGDIEALLINHGWKLYNQKGDRKRYTRPGKNSGVSADWHTGKRTLYCFSGAPETELPAGAKGYSPATVFIQLEAGGDTKIAYQKLKQLGF